MTDQTPETPAVAKDVNQAIINVMNEVGYVQKSRTQNLNYSFAGEVALIKALRPEMVKQGLFLYPSGTREVIRDTFDTANGKSMNTTVVSKLFRMVHAPSGTWIEIGVEGEGSDVGDKSANKALTGAYKYALRQAFMIETGDDPDATSSDTMERSAKKNGNAKPTVTKPAATKAHTQDELVAYAISKGIEPTSLGALLGLAGFGNEDLKTMEKFDGMCLAIAAKVQSVATVAV
jgi:hypothetical protein